MRVELIKTRSRVYSEKDDGNCDIFECARNATTSVHVSFPLLAVKKSAKKFFLHDVGVQVKNELSSKCGFSMFG